METNVSQERISKMGWSVIIAVFVALVVDGMDLQMLSLALPVISQDFAINKILAGSLGTYTLFGMGVGGLIAGWLADKIGRVRVTLCSIIIFSTMTAALAFTQTYWQFAVIRFLSGLGIAALYSIGTMMAAEYIPTSKRNTVLGTLQAGWSVGYILAAMVSSYILPIWGWRPMFFVTLIPALLSIWLMRGVNEPESYTAARKTMEGRSIWGELFADPKSRKYFVIWTIAMIGLQFGYYGANTWLPSYLVTGLGINLKSMGWYIAGTYTMMIFGKIGAGYISDRLGRRVTWTSVGLATAVSLPLIMAYATPASAAYLLLIFGFFYGAPYAILATYISESFPTRFRGTAVASTNALGRAGSMFAPLAIGIAAEQYSIAYGIGLMGIAYAICALVPGIFVGEKLYDPKAVDSEPPSVTPSGTGKAM